MQSDSELTAIGLGPYKKLSYKQKSKRKNKTNFETYLKKLFGSPGT